MPPHVPILAFYPGAGDGGYYEIGCTCKPWFGGDHNSPEMAFTEWQEHAGEREPRTVGDKILGNRRE